MLICVLAFGDATDNNKQENSSRFFLCLRIGTARTCLDKHSIMTTNATYGKSVDTHEIPSVKLVNELFVDIIGAITTEVRYFITVPRIVIISLSYEITNLNFVGNIVVIKNDLLDDIQSRVVIDRNPRVSYS